MGANKEQLQAINSKSDRILCLAGAGAGKSFTLLERISKLVDDGVLPSAILALTFTNAAGAEMRERYETKHVGQLTPEFRTFHSFCYSIVCKDPAIRSGLGYESIPDIASEAQEKEIIEKAKAQCKITLSSDQLAHRDALSKKEQFQAELFDKAVYRLLRQDNLITFDKLNSEVADLFAADHISTKPYKMQYKYIFVDEFQDTDAHQIKFLNSFTDTNFFFVGDTLQNIYSFRGTDNTYIKALSGSEGWEKITLFTNYRSTNQICEFANTFSASYADDSYRIEMKGTRDGEKVVTKIVDGPSRYEAINTDSIDDVLKELSNLSGTSAILVRTNKELSEVTSYLNKNDVEYTSSRDTKTVHLLECAVSDEYMIGWLASYLTSNKYGEYIRLSAQRAPDINWFLKTYGNNTKIDSDAKKINKLRTIATDPKPIAKKIKEAEELLKVKGIAVPDKELFGRDFLDYIKETATEIKSSELYVGTIHSVKGLEYDNVFVMNVGSYSFQIDSSEEMSNLYYVAITRAKNRLYVYKIAKWF
jgi:DNA helicase-2/ATP-dependent DNA helicase PcrA